MNSLLSERERRAIESITSRKHQLLEGVAEEVLVDEEEGLFLPEVVMEEEAPAASKASKPADGAWANPGTASTGDDTPF